ncbi:MAG: NitT/TauT family transport system permease protein [Massilia sp.]|nr:NitT/TauT family transport system permease protein [Massilia sp.]
MSDLNDRGGAAPGRVRNLRSPWAVGGELPKTTLSVLAATGFLLPLLAWMVISTGGLVDAVFLPTPPQVLKSVQAWASEGDLFSDIGISIGRVYGGFALAVLVALPLGIALGAVTPVRALLEPLIDFSRYLPAVAFIPLIMLWVGIEESAKVAVIFVGTVCQMVLLVAGDIARVPDASIEAARTMGASNQEVIQHVLIPAAWPAMFDTLRAMMGLSWTYLVVAELVAASSGLGFSILKAQRFLQTDRIFAGILLIGLVGLVTDQAFRWLHRRAFSWFYLRG